MGVELPKRIYKKDRIFQNGTFVARNVKIAEDGKALFGQVEGDRVVDMLVNRKCQTCGQRIAKTTFACFVGGPNDHFYKEAPQHIECARFALQVCPHILRRRDRYAVSVCRRYDMLEVPDVEPMAIPVWDNLEPWAVLALSMAHSVSGERNEEGQLICDNCGRNHMGMMNYDEFMKWSEYLGD